MDKSVVEKTDTGYILRQRNAETVLILCLILFLGLILPVGVLVGWAEGEPKDTGFVIAAWSVFLACVLFGLAVLRSEWRHMVIDYEGIRFYRPLAKVKHVSWDEVKEWGILYQGTRYGFAYYLYFSTEPLKPARRGRNKKLPMTYRKTAYLHLYMEDYPDIKRSGLISFCRQRLGWNNKNARNFVAMFMADIVS